MVRTRQVIVWYLPIFGLAATFLLASLLVILSFSRKANDWCAEQALACSLSTNLIAVLVVAGVSFFWLFGYRRSRLLSEYRRQILGRVRQRWISDDTVPLSRQTTVRLAVSEVLQTQKIGTVVLRGDRGDGKTTVLTMAAVQLLKSWRIPIYLDAVPNLDDTLSSLRDSLSQVLASSLRTDAELDTFWRLLLRCDRVVILIDDIDEFDSVGNAVRLQTLERLVELTRRLRLPVLATAQNSALQRLPVSSIYLPKFSRLDVTRYLMARSPSSQMQNLESVTAELPEELMSPFYLQLIAERLELGDVTDFPPSLAGQVKLIHSWLEQMLARSNTVVSSPETLVRSLSCLALSMTYRGLSACEIDNIPSIYSRIQEFLDGAEQIQPAHVREGVELGLLDPECTLGRIVFAHSLVQAFLGALALKRKPSIVSTLAAYELSPLMNTTQIFGLSLERLEIDSRTRSISGTLALASMGRQGNDRVDLLTNIVLGTQNKHPQVVNLLVRSLPQATSATTTKRAVSSLNVLPSAIRSGHLWTVCKNARYSIRMEAALSLARSGAATPSLLDEFAEIFDRVEAARDSGGHLHNWRYALPMWLLPSAVELDDSHYTNGLLGRALELCKRPLDPVNFEMSLSRGFKLAAWLRRDCLVSPAALSLLNEPPRFWLSRLNLIHALALRIATGADQRSIVRHALVKATRDSHPFVREAAKICVTCIKSGGNVETAVWLHEADAISKPEVSYSDRTWRLLGDVYLHLNQITLADIPKATLWNEATRLPSCLGSGRTRTAIFEGCPTECDYGLCPYPFPSRASGDRGEISAYFCQVQRDVAQRIGPASWQGGIRTSSLTDYWRRAEGYDALAKRG